MNKWYKYNPETILQNEKHNVHWDFQIQMDHLISARYPDLVIVEKREPVKKNTLPYQQTTE